MFDNFGPNYHHRR